MGKIHYAIGGLITPEKSEFSTMCGRKFPKGTSDIMQSGYTGAKNVTCEDCRWRLDIQEPIKDLIWYEVTDGKGMSSQRFYSQKEAELYLRNARRGFPKKVMSDDNHKYWKQHGKREYIVKITEKRQLVSF